MTHRDDDDAVGYGKPPKKHRFRKGQSGNPKGRPKGSQNFTKLLEKTLSRKMAIIENGSRKTITTQEAALRKLAAKALQGEGRALDRLIQMAADNSAEKEARSAERILSAGEEEILARFLENNTRLGASNEEQGDD